MKEDMADWVSTRVKEEIEGTFRDIAKHLRDLASIPETEKLTGQQALWLAANSLESIWEKK